MNTLADAYTIFTSIKAEFQTEASRAVVNIQQLSKMLNDLKAVNVELEKFLSVHVPLTLRAASKPVFHIDLNGVCLNPEAKQ